MKIKSITVFLLILSFSLNISCAHISAVLNYEDPLTAEEHNNLGVAYEKEEKYKLAVKEYKLASKKDEALVTPLINIGNVYFKQGKFKNAEEYYLKALKKDDNNVLAANNLGNVYLETGKDYDKGIEILINTLPPPEIAPAYALDTLAMLYAQSGSDEKAVELLLIACTRAEGDEEIKSEISLHLKEMGEFECSK